MLSEAVAECPDMSDLHVDFTGGNNSITKEGEKYIDKLKGKITRIYL